MSCLVLSCLDPVTPPDSTARKERHRRHHATHTCNADAVPHKTRTTTLRQHPTGSSRSRLYAAHRTTLSSLHAVEAAPGRSPLHAAHRTTLSSPCAAQAGSGRSPLHEAQHTTPHSTPHCRPRAPLRQHEAGHLCMRRSAPHHMSCASLCHCHCAQRTAPATTPPARAPVQADCAFQ